MLRKVVDHMKQESLRRQNDQQSQIDQLKARLRLFAAETAQQSGAQDGRGLELAEPGKERFNPSPHSQQPDLRSAPLPASPNETLSSELDAPGRTSAGAAPSSAGATLYTGGHNAEEQSSSGPTARRASMLLFP